MRPGEAELKRAVAAYARARDNRDQAIRDAVSAGWSYRDIAAATGLSFQRVAQLAKEDD